MALKALTQPFWPWPFYNSSAGPAAFSMTASGHRIAVIVRAPKSGTLDGVEWRTGAASGSTERISFQDVDLATGFPDGTVDQYRTAVAPSSGWQAWGLVTDDGTNTGVKRTVVQGDYFAIVLDFTSFVNSQTLVYAALGSAFDQWEHALTYNGSAWTASISALPHFVLKYDDGTYAAVEAAALATPFTASSFQAYKSNDSPNEYGNRFQSVHDARVGGVTVMLGDAALGAYQVTLYDASSNVLAGPITAFPLSPLATTSIALVQFETDVDITKNTTYRIGIKPTTTTNIRLYYFDVDSAAIMAACPLGSACHSTSRTGSGAWTDLNTRRFYAAPFYTALPDGVAA